MYEERSSIESKFPILAFKLQIHCDKSQTILWTEIIQFMITDSLIGNYTDLEEFITIHTSSMRKMVAARAT